MRIGLHSQIYKASELHDLFVSWGLDVIFDEFNDCEVLFLEKDQFLNYQKKPGQRIVLWNRDRLDENKFEDFLSEDGSAFYGPSLLTSSSGLIILKRFLGLNSSLRPEEAYENSIHKFNSLYIEKHNSIGKAIDKISQTAGEIGVSVVDASLAITSILHYFSSLVKSEHCQLPIDVDYGFTEKDFFVQIHARYDHISGHDIKFGFVSQDKKKTYSSALSFALQRVDILDIYNLESGKKLVMTCIWSKENESHYAQNLSINRIDKFKVESKDVGLKLEEYKKKEIEKTETKEYLGTPIPSLEQSKSGKLVRLKRIVNYINKIRSKEVVSVAVNELTDKHIKNYLLKYPKQDVVNILNEEDFNFIIDCLSDHSIDISFNESFKKIIQSDYDDNYLNNIITTVSNLTVDDLQEIIISDTTENIEEGIQRVHGWINEDKQVEVIKGSFEDIGDLQYKTVVKGENSQEQVQKNWEIKRTEISGILKDKINSLKKSDLKPDEIEKSVNETLLNCLKINDSDSSHIAHGVLEFAAEPFVTKKLGKQSDEFRERLELDKYKNQSYAKDHQIMRMKRIIDGMKEELANVKKTHEADRNAKAEKMSADSTSDFKNKLFRIEKEKQDLSDKLHFEEKKNKDLIEQLTSAKNKESELLNKEKSSENNELTVRPNFSEERKLRLSAIREARKYERKIFELEAEILRLGSPEMESALESTKEGMGKVQEELAKAQAGLKVQLLQNHENNLAVKKLEHKNRILTSQLEEANRKLNNTMNTGSKSGGNLEGRLKQLERLNEKLTSSNKKNVADLADKKKEVIELNKEVVTLKNKIQELERKLSKFEKQAA